MFRFAFAGSPIDRSAHLRSDAESLQALKSGPGAKVISIFGDAVLLAGGALDVSRPAGAEAVFLGMDADGQPWFAQAAASAEGCENLRAIMLAGTLPAPQLAMLAQARSLIHWHESHRFCARCGAASQLAEGGYRRHCNACGADHFPRTDPVVIMAVYNGGKVLLGRQAAWTAGMYSTLAGFLEPGETIEEAVAREVREEAGIKVRNVQYVASQPWPFPASLMIGAMAEAVSDVLSIDKTELEDARWFTREEARQMLERSHPDGLYASHPYAIAHHLLKAVLER